MDQERPRRPRSVFWRVAAAVIVVQLATGLLAIGLSAYLASDRSLDLAENSLRMRLDAVAEEIERSNILGPAATDEMPVALASNLSFRFPDPLVIADYNGRAVHAVYPSPEAFEGEVADSTVVPIVIPGLDHILDSGEIFIDRRSDILVGGTAITPLYSPSGLLIGAVILQPIERTLNRELAPTREAFRMAMLMVSVTAVILAIIFATALTWWLVNPLRRISERVSEIGGGNYKSRVDVSSGDEIGRLGEAINQMAEQVETSVESLQSTDRMRRELVANVGHDLRTPLAALRGHLEEAIRYNREQREIEAMEAVASAEKQANYLESMVDDLFELSQLENPTPQLRFEPVPVAELLGEVERAHRSRFKKQDISFVTQLDAALPVLRADGLRLKRMFDNLLSNAARHTSSGGEVHLVARISDSVLRVEVWDSGEGMDGETLANVFERYYRGASSRTRGHKGTGLGLAISRAVAELHGGTLRAESRPGQGTRMIFEVPVIL